jgi:glycosyltransferase involved in cell wall biosynthesis
MSFASTAGVAAAPAATAGAVPSLRILYVYDALYPEVMGGAERRYGELASRLAVDHEVSYLTWRFWEEPGDTVRSGVRLIGVGPAPMLYGADGKRRIKEVLAFSLRIFPALLRQRVDVIDCAAVPTLPLYATWLAAKITRTPLVVTWHEYWGEHWLAYLPERPRVAQVARTLESVSRRFGQWRVAVSAFTADRLGREHTDVLSVVANGVAASEIAAAESAAPTDILFVGRLIDEKRVHLLLHAIARLAGARPSLRATIVGEGPERAPLTALVAELGLINNVHFTGRLPTAELHEALRGASVLVLPSAREGYGMVVTEAQAAGAVPVVTRGPATAAPSLIRDGIDGVVCDDNPDAIAAAISGLLDDPARRTRMAAAGRAAAAAVSWDRVTEQMTTIYRAVTAR